MPITRRYPSVRQSWDSDVAPSVGQRSDDDANAQGESGTDDENDDRHDDELPSKDGVSPTNSHPYPKLANQLADSKWALGRSTFLRHFDSAAYNSRTFLRQLVSWVEHGSLEIDEVHRQIQATWKQVFKWPPNHPFSLKVLTVTLERLQAQGLEKDVPLRKDYRKRPNKGKTLQREAQGDNGPAARESAPPATGARRNPSASVFRVQTLQSKARPTSVDIDDDEPNAGNAQITSTTAGAQQPRGQKRKQADIAMDSDPFSPDKRARARSATTNIITYSKKPITTRPRNAPLSNLHTRTRSPPKSDRPRTPQPRQSPSSPSPERGRTTTDELPDEVSQLDGAIMDDQAEDSQGTLHATGSEGSRTTEKTMETDWTLASFTHDALKIFAPASCRILDSSTLNLDRRRVFPSGTLTIGKHHTEAALPVLKGGKHWGLATLDLRSGTGKFIDLRGTNGVVSPDVNDALVKLGERLCADKEWRFSTVPTAAPQLNSDDCGPHTVAAAAMNHWYSNDSLPLESIDTALWKVTLDRAVAEFRSPSTETEPLGPLDDEQTPDQEMQGLLASKSELGSLDDVSLYRLQQTLREKIEGVIRDVVPIRSQLSDGSLRKMLDGSNSEADRLLQQMDQEKSIREDYVAINAAAKERAKASRHARHKAKLENWGAAEIRACDQALAGLARRRQEIGDAMRGIEAATRTRDRVLGRALEQRLEAGNQIRDLNARVEAELAARKNKVWEDWNSAVMG